MASRSPQFGAPLESPRMATSSFEPMAESPTWANSISTLSRAWWSPLLPVVNDTARSLVRLCAPPSGISRLLSVAGTPGSAGSGTPVTPTYRLRPPDKSRTLLQVNVASGFQLATFAMLKPAAPPAFSASDAVVDNRLPVATVEASWSTVTQ